ncbi:DUF397 domain-containing protein [Actinokineospora sp. NBRC 105648]|uniref:DUF397 domain-containing protein n=1 Tax=Actinokineospora sp. NBRC 105648 TaxID=3032206 RepID=UPI0024A43521|nr:DUF397 domain-containing protein [Actinokineospora sp. NBRC 105648]GLZ41120.1 toxin [Actinokineospora sp. NBRC 105648]
MIEPGIDWTTVPFRKSSFSDTNGGQCVEIGWADATFRKSSFSQTNGGECVEVAHRTDLVGVRDSKSPTSGLLELPTTSWTAFTTALQA